MNIIPFKKRRKGWLDPFSEMESIQKEMNKLFNFSLGSFQNPWEDVNLLDSEWTPSIDMYESEDNILVKADIPGLNKDDIEVSVQNNNLIIKGEKKHEHEVKEDKYHRVERAYGSFQRSVPLSSEIDESKVEAKYKDGVLSLTLPKKEESKPKKIAIDIK